MKKYIELKSLILDDLAPYLKDNDIVGAFEFLKDDPEYKSEFYNFLVEVLDINPLQYFAVIPAGFFTDIEIPEVIIPDTITKLAEGCFENSKVARVQFNTNRVYEIPANCFKGSKNLANVVLSRSITYLGKDAFSNCASNLRIYTFRDIVESHKFSFYVDPADPSSYTQFMQEHLKLS